MQEEKKDDKKDKVEELKKSPAVDRVEKKKGSWLAGKEKWKIIEKIIKFYYII